MLCNYVDNASMNGNRRRPTEHEERINMLRAERDYEYREDIFDERDERIIDVLRIVWQNLTKDERRLLILYAECDSNCSKTARQLGVSPPTIAAAIKDIRMKVLNIYDNRYDRNNSNDF